MRASIPSPSSGVVHLGPLPLRAYAGFILLGAVLAVYFGDKRWVARGGKPGFVADVAATAVPAGLVGARIYHVLTSRQDFYFSHPVEMLKIWQGGLGIWGGIAGGAVGAWWVLRKHGIPFLDFADALAPFLPLAQAVGRVGNYFNQELYGKRTSLPWGLEIDAAHSPGGNSPGTYQPTFLYELLWDLGVMGLVLWADNRWKLGRGRAFALYVAGYCAGRLWIEALRIDDAHKLFGVRLNDFTSGILFLAAVAFLWLRRDSRKPSPADVPSSA
ncbi:MAG: prolipoprotein diacylglyceryl transferase [Frankiales bacterium]|nr:prolipoprotein diacylglyceryl transferase [Frankiales bacterium]